MTAKTPPRGPGRPRSFPPGTTGADRKALARRELRAAGGHVLTVDLGAAAWVAIQQLAGRNARSAYIEKLILAAARAERTKGAGAGDREKGAGASRRP